MIPAIIACALILSAFIAVALWLVIRAGAEQDRLTQLVQQERDKNASYRVQREKSLSPERRAHIDKVLGGYVRPRGGVL